MLYKLVNSGAVAEVHGTISTGKESVVVYAKGYWGFGLKDRDVVLVVVVVITLHCDGGARSVRC